MVPAATGSFDDAERVRALAERFTPEAVQLHYQIATQGRVDLALAPDEATGMAMALLRMLAFVPVAGSDPDVPALPRSADRAAPSTRSRSGRAAASETPPAPGGVAGSATGTTTGTTSAAAAPAGERATVPRPSAATARAPVTLPQEPEDWPAFVASLKLTGMAAQLAAQSAMVSLAGHVLTLAVPVAARHLTDKVFADKLKSALDQATGRKLLLAFEVGAPTSGSLAATERRERAEAQAQREAAFREEPFVRDLIARFDGAVKTDSITPFADKGESN